MNPLRRVRFSWRRRLLCLPAWIVAAIAAAGTWRLWYEGLPLNRTFRVGTTLPRTPVGFAYRNLDEEGWHFSVGDPFGDSTASDRMKIHFAVDEFPSAPASRWLEPTQCTRWFQTDAQETRWSGTRIRPLLGASQERAARLGILDQMAAAGINPSIVDLARKGSDQGRLYWPGIRTNACRLAAPLTALLTLAALWRTLTSNKSELAAWRLAHGQCPSCAYPLVGISEARVCPECGATIGAT